MAKIVNQIEQASDETAFTLLATLGLLVCFVCALLGIKVWWFKHRLTFEHGNTRNGAAGGASPAVVMRSRSRDKRFSQQFREPVEVHGVFRKRGEDDLEIVPTAQLPPVRIHKMSQSTPALWLPPKKRTDSPTSSNSTFETLSPPIRLPPKPPTSPTDSLTSLPAPAVACSDDGDSMSAEIETRFKRMELTKPRPMSVDTAFMSQYQRAPDPPKRINRNFSSDAPQTTHHFVKAKVSYEPEGDTKKVSERRPTGYVPPSVEELQKLAQEDDMKEGYIKYEEIDNESLADFQNVWRNKPETPQGVAFPIQHNFSTFKIEDVSKSGEEENELKWPVNRPIEVNNWEMQRQNNATPVSIASVEYTSIEDDPEGPMAASILKQNEPKHFKNYNEHFVDDYDWRHEKQIVAERNVKFAMQPLDEDNEKDTIRVRRPTGYVRSDRQSWDNLETNLHTDEAESRLWLEMEQDINHDFIVNLDEEFNKIRSSYAENEAEVLETKYLDEDSEDTAMVPQPRGFGKNIDDDWENFTQLDSARNESRNGHGTVSFSVTENDYGNDKESVLRTTRRPTSFVHNVQEIHKELDRVDDRGEHKIEYNKKVHYEEGAQIIETQVECTSILKERRPTGYVRRGDFNLDLEEEDGEEDHKNDIFEPIEERKPRPKVTFDFNTTEHSYTPQSPVNEDTDTEIVTDDDDESYETASPEIPKPMQRMSKTVYIEEHKSTDSLNAPPLLFGTQVSLLNDLEADMNDSWAAIRQRRFINEEYLQYSAPATTTTTNAPIPAYRNPLAQLAVREAEHRETFVPVPRTATEGTKPQPQSRHFFGDNHDTSTEA